MQAHHFRTTLFGPVGEACCAMLTKGLQGIGAPATIIGCSAIFQLSVLNRSSSPVKNISASTNDARVTPATVGQSSVQWSDCFCSQPTASKLPCKSRSTYCRWIGSADFSHRTGTARRKVMSTLQRSSHAGPTLQQEANQMWSCHFAASCTCLPCQSINAALTATRLHLGLCQRGWS